MCEKFKLKAKGKTSDFEGATTRRRYYVPKARRGVSKAPCPRPLLQGPILDAMIEYATNDAARTMELMTILLPLLSNPVIELALQRHTLKMYTQPTLLLDMDAARVLRDELQTDVDAALVAAFPEVVKD